MSEDRSQDIGSLIKAIANAKDAEENRQLRRYGITAMQMHVLLYISDSEAQKCTLKELERGLHVSQSTMAKVVRNLVENKHLASYTDDPNDKRVKWVCLTPEAVPICQSSGHIAVAMENRLREGLTPRETDELRVLLKRIYDHLEK